MADKFEPKTPFEGYVHAKLENLDKRFDNLPCSESFKRINTLEKDISNIKGQAGVIGIIAGAIAGVLTKKLF